MHYYKFNIADYRKDTSHLSTLEHGIYRQLIDWYYLDEKPIPLETESVMRRLRLVSDDIASLKNVLADFFECRATGYHQLRCDLEINDYHHNAAINKENGKLGGRPKKTERVVSANRTESESKGNHEPLTTNQEPLKEPKGSSPVNRTPSQQLLDIFHTKCQYVPKVTVFNDARKRTLKARFSEVMLTEKWTVEQTIDWFGDLYDTVNKSRFLTGRAPPGRDGRAFKADWDWIHGPQNFVKIVEGKYSGD